jgi:hypothetical protein
MSLVPGTRLGPYEILAPIGAGAMELVQGEDLSQRRQSGVSRFPRRSTS